MASTKILFIHHDSQISGSTISLRNLLSTIDRKQFQPYIVLAQPGPAQKLYEELKIPVTLIPMRGFPTFPGYRWNNINFWKSWLCFLPNHTLANYLQALKPDVIHINDKMMLTAGIIAKKNKLPVIWHMRSSYNVTYTKLAAYVSKMVIRSLSDHIIAISEDEIDGFEDYENLSIVYNSVDFHQVGQALLEKNKIIQEMNLEGAIVIGTVSTAINEIRGTYDFIWAASHLKKLLPDLNFKFLVVAKIPLNEDITHGTSRSASEYRRALGLVKDLGLEGEFVFTGFRKDALAIMGAMDVVVVCNRHGVLGRMPFEAMALGRPLVATAGHSGKSRVVVDGVTGLIVPAGEPETIASAVHKLLTNPQLAKTIGENGRDYAHKYFDPVLNTRQVENLYIKILEKQEITRQNIHL